MNQTQELLAFRRDVYSQNGEDGVLEEILRRLSLTAESHWCVEFGAWDGKHLSNTFRLVQEEAWSALYIESDPEKFRALEATAVEFVGITPKLGLVGGLPGQGGALDDFLLDSGVPSTYGLLSIDIDSSDLEVWARHEDYRPVIVVIEIDSSIPPRNSSMAQ